MKYNRLREIEEYVQQRDFVSLDELCEVFNKSKNTIRRDVAELVKSGSFQKVYGGVRPIHAVSEVLSTFSDRAVKRAGEKQQIGRLAARFVEDGNIIFVDSGTTTVQLVPFLADFNKLTVVTNNLHVINRCIEYPHITTITVGGQLNTKTASFSTNFFTIENLKSLNITKAFMAATGVSIEGGVSNSSAEELAIKRTIVEKCESCYLMADTSKFGHTALLTYAQLRVFRGIVTNGPLPAEYQEYAAQHDMELVF